MNIKQMTISSYITKREEGLDCEVAFQLALNWVQHRLLLKVHYLNEIHETGEGQLLLQEYQNIILEQFTLTQMCELNFQAYRQGGTVHEVQLQ